MLIKIIGSVIIFFCSNLLGFYYIFKTRAKINNLKQISNALDILKSEIEFGFNNLDQALKNISHALILDQQNNFIKSFFDNIALDLKKKNYSAKNIWLKQINLLAKKIYIDQDDIFNLKSFSQVISNLDYKLQINSLKKIILGLEQKILSLEKNYSSQKKLYFNLGFLSGLLIIIIFI